MQVVKTNGILFSTSESYIAVAAQLIKIDLLSTPTTKS